MESNIIYLSSEDEEEDLQMLSIRKVGCPVSPTILASVSSTAVAAPQEEIYAPTPSSSEQQHPIVRPRPRSVDLGSSEPCSGLALVRAASAPHGGQSAPAAAGSHPLPESRASASLMCKQLAPANAISTKATALEVIGGISNMAASDPATSFSSGSQAIRPLATREKPIEQRTTAVSEHPTADNVPPAGTAATSTSPQIVKPVPLADPFASGTLRTENAASKKSASLQNALFKAPSLPISRNRTQNIHLSDTTQRACPINQWTDDDAFYKLLDKSLDKVLDKCRTDVRMSPITQSLDEVPRKRKRVEPQSPLSQSLDKALDKALGIGNRNLVERVNQIPQSPEEALRKRQRVETQAEISTSTPSKRNRTLWSIPAYDPSKDPATKTASDTESANITQTASPTTPRTAIDHLAKLTPTRRSTIGVHASKEEIETALAESRATAAKFHIPRTAKFSVPRNPSMTQPLPYKPPSRTPAAPAAPVAPPPTPASTSTTTTLPSSSSSLTPTASAKKASKPWTSREYAELATLAFHSFPFAAFAATHSKTEAEVFNTFSAIIQLPIFQHSANGLRRAKLAKERVRAFKNGLKEVREMHKAEEKEARKEAGGGRGNGRGNGNGNGNGRKAGVGSGSGTEEDRAVGGFGKGVLGAAVARGLGRE